MKSVCRIAAILAAIAAGATSLGAHEIGTTVVTARFHSSGTYTIEIRTDAASLLEKFEAVSGESPADPRSETFRSRVVLAFDGVPVDPVVDYAAAENVACLKLTGAIPPGARQFTWKYGWTFATYALTIHKADGTSTTVWLEGNETSAPVDLSSVVAAPDTRWTIAVRYLMLGFTHIVPHGLDHMLFVLGIFLLSRRLKQVLVQVSAFTVAHSITLGLSIYGVVSLPSAIVEPLIAVSIAYVAVENLFVSELKPWRVALVFGFGLLHGLGFAGALQEVGLPRSEFLTALLTFNIGVEAAQLSVIGAAFALVGWQFSKRDWYRARVVFPTSAVIAFTAIYWTIQRLSI